MTPTLLDTSQSEGGGMAAAWAQPNASVVAEILAGRDLKTVGPVPVLL
jgi:hypothetical protein